MKKIQLKLAVMGGALSAWLHRNSGAIALGNANPPPVEKAAAPSKAEAELAQITSDAKEVKTMTAVGLTHEQATAAVQHKRDFVKAHAKMQSETKAAKK